MLFYLKNSYSWTVPEPIPLTAVNPVMFLSCCLMKAKLYYGLSELEVACLV